MTNTSANRRVFIEDGSGNSFQILKFSQHKDGTIYCGAPRFGESKWYARRGGDEQTFVEVNSTVDDGKVSFHSLGRTHIKAHTSGAKHQLVRFGSLLVGETLGVRHLFTGLFGQLSNAGKSPAGARRSDVVLRAAHISPFAMVFFAIPSPRKMSLEMACSFHVDDAMIPPDAGFGSFGLQYHSIAWMHYRTKHMGAWPEVSHFCYDDGYRVPIFLGGPAVSGIASGRVELREPNYALEGDAVKIAM
jgi:hypothetical protein